MKQQPESASLRCSSAAIFGSIPLGEIAVDVVQQVQPVSTASAARADGRRAIGRWVPRRSALVVDSAAMSTLNDILLAPGNRPKVVVDCVRLIDEEVDSKGGLTGLAVKGAYALVKAVKPGFVSEAVDHMLDDFVKRLEPFYAAAQSKNEPIGPALNARAGEVAEALLAISDERAAAREEQHPQEGLREAAPDGQEARRGRRAARRPPDREVRRPRPRPPPRRRAPEARREAAAGDATERFCISIASRRAKQP